MKKPEPIPAVEWLDLDRQGWPLASQWYIDSHRKAALHRCLIFTCKGRTLKRSAFCRRHRDVLLEMHECKDAAMKAYLMQRS